MAKIIIDTDDLLAGDLGAAFIRQEQLLMDFSTATQSALAQLQAAQDVTAAGLKALTDRILATPTIVLTDDGAAQIAALQAQLSDANAREAAVAAAISSSAQVFSLNLNSALALVQPQAPTPAENPTAPAPPEPGPDTSTGGQGNDAIVFDPTAGPTVPIVEAPVNPDAGQPIEVPAAPADNAYMAAQGATQPFEG